MRRSYSHYRHEDIKALGIEIKSQKLFGRTDSIRPIPPSDFLLQSLAMNQQLPLQSEKAKSELLITPILNEVWARNKNEFTYFSGYQFNVDSKIGLKGFCDFIISRKYNAVFIESPVIAIVEAKHNQDLVDAVPQCVAEMYAAQLFNQRQGEAIDVIYGIVTTGYDWLFLRLVSNAVLVDTERYFLKNLAELLGIWQLIIDETRTGGA
ncbi:conserved hypothetical protein [Gammaproteobacteria bacterium]